MSDITPPARPADDQSVTEHERKLLQWLAAGRTAHDIAQRMRRPQHAVEKHIAALLARLGVSTPAEALALVAAAPDAAAEADPTAEADTAAADASQA